jgi:hypothetical protein
MTRDEIRAKIDSIAQRLRDDPDFRSQMEDDPEETLIGAGLGEEAAVVLSDDWRGAVGAAAGGRQARQKACEVNKSCRFTESTDPCGPTATSLRCSA